MLEHLTITPLSHSGTDKRYVISNGSSFFEANESTVKLVRELMDARDLDEGIDNFMARYDAGMQRDELKSFITTRLIDKLNSPVTKRQFLYQHELISGSVLTCFSSVAKCLFRPWMMALIVACAIAAEILFFTRVDGVFRFGIGMNWVTVIVLIAFVIASSALHELGHATACRYLGIGHGGVGIGLHFSFPVFYTDVSQAWVLSRRKRCLVNVAGIYFQLILIAVLVAVYMVTGSDLLRYMIITVNMGFVLTLNPFFKFDGYWLATDILGVTNLRKKTNDVLKYFVGKLKREKDLVKPEILKLPRLVRSFALCYAVCINLFFGYFFFYTIPSFLISLIKTLPGQLREITYFASHRMIPPFSSLVNLFSELLFAFLIGLMLYNLFKGLWNKRGAIK